MLGAEVVGILATDLEYLDEVDKLCRRGISRRARLIELGNKLRTL
jgi:hypothetical protein